MTMYATSSFNEPSLRDLILYLSAAKIWILAGLIAGLILAFVFMALAVPQYRATMLLAPTTRTGTPDVSALFPQNSSYALEYVMRSFSSGDSSDFMRLEQIIRAPSVAARLLSVDKAGPLSPPQRWRFFDPASWRSAEDMAASLEKNIRIEPVGNTPLRRIMIDHHEPEKAKTLLSALYVAGDDIIRGEMREKTENRVKWLSIAVAETINPEHRRALTSLLMEQEQVRMILSLNEPFAATLAEPAAASPKPVWPKKSIVFPVFAFAGMMLGLFLQALCAALRKPA